MKLECPNSEDTAASAAFEGLAYTVAPDELSATSVDMQASATCTVDAVASGLKSSKRLARLVGDFMMHQLSLTR